MPTIFVTVGTTLFEALIQAVTIREALEWMSQNGYTRLVVQYGKGAKPTIPEKAPPIQVDCYDFKASLADDMKEADLILSHAGAGTVMEILRMQKRAAVVINTILMHNHQTELAHAMGERGHLYVVETPELLLQSVDDTWKKIHEFKPTPHTGGNAHDVPHILDHFLFHHNDDPTKTA